MNPSHAWFSEARFGLFIHWGPYSLWGRGEQVLFREHMEPAVYHDRACRWNPRKFDPGEWARIARDAGMRYAVLTTRHHDGYCLWDTKETRYSSVHQAPGRDFVREYVDAFRAAGMRVGLYYSLANWRIPAYWDPTYADPAAWERFRDSTHRQVRELLTQYGRIDVLWFDGAWPHSSQRWESRRLVTDIRALQPDILINNRLGVSAIPDESADDGMEVGASAILGDFSTPEHAIVADRTRLWESCQTSTSRLWGYVPGERWRSADQLLDFLTESAARGGNLLLNVGPDPDGRFPPEFVERMKAIGLWMTTHGECIYGSQPGNVTEPVTYGRQIVKGDNLYLIIRFWPCDGTLRIAGLANPVRRATLLTTGQELALTRADDVLTLSHLPERSPCALFPVIRLECEGKPAAGPSWARERLWGGDPRRMIPWAERFPVM